ncbi:MAG: biotin carboxylase [Phycisphaeraceae bacterium]|nr:biotin carboxylase [Phycisphaeraceae bacterium]MCB9848381.1 biotin carboxylase [Phycisphaeraceae bacterium]
MTSNIDTRQAEPRPRASSPGSPIVSDKSKPGAPSKRLNDVSDIRRFFYRNDEPIYFISATNFNLLGMDEWIRHFTFINYIDCFDGQHPNVFVPGETPHEPFTSIEDINNYLLSHKEVIDFIKKRGPGGKAVFLMFDERTEELCRELGLEVCFPPAALRSRIDDKMETTRIADRAGVESVPNVLDRIESYADLRAKAGHLGPELVIQTAYGDSGHTTFFISSEDDWNEYADEITEAPEVKVMKKIRCRGSALEACATRHGTIVGPLMTELVGFPELTPYKGGWCGNEVYADTFTAEVRAEARRAAFAFGEELRKLGYRGYFEIDFLTDLDSGKVYLGECNPRITGASSMTNLASFCHADAPLFLFHLLEWMGIDYNIDVDAINDRWASADNIDSWSQLVIKHTAGDVDHIVAAPPSGIWELNDDGTIRYVRMQTHRRTVQYENRAFYLRISGAGDYRYEGADLGILVSPGRFMDDEFRLNDRAKAWIRGIRDHYLGQPLPPAQEAPVQETIDNAGFKLL